MQKLNALEQQSQEVGQRYIAAKLSLANIQSNHPILSCRGRLGLKQFRPD